MAKAKQRDASSNRRAHEGKDDKTKVFLPWVESGDAEETWKRKMKNVNTFGIVSFINRILQMYVKWHGHHNNFHPLA